MPPVGAPLSATRTVSVEPVWAPARGERIDRCGVGALTGFAAVLAGADAGARVVAEVPPPQPLAARTNPKLTKSGPALNALLTSFNLRRRGVVIPSDSRHLHARAYGDHYAQRRIRLLASRARWTLPIGEGPEGTHLLGVFIYSRTTRAGTVPDLQGVNTCAIY